MFVQNIYYGRDFEKQFISLSAEAQKIAFKKEALFRSNPLHPSLRLHQLKGDLQGLWSISVSMNYRIIFYREENGDIVFVSVGKHDIYKSL